MSKEIRIKLDTPAFNALVRGGEVEVHTEEGGVVRMILSDIGFANMRGAINRAEAQWNLYQGVKTNCDGDEIK